jgi:hypothetical protein
MSAHASTKDVEVHEKLVKKVVPKDAAVKKKAAGAGAGAGAKAESSPKSNSAK